MSTSEISVTATPNALVIVTVEPPSSTAPNSGSALIAVTVFSATIVLKSPVSSKTVIELAALAGSVLAVVPCVVTSTVNSEVPIDASVVIPVAAFVTVTTLPTSVAPKSATPPPPHW